MNYTIDEIFEIENLGYIQVDDEGNVNYLNSTWYVERKEIHNG